MRKIVVSWGGPASELAFKDTDDIQFSAEVGGSGELVIEKWPHGDDTFCPITYKIYAAGEWRSVTFHE